MKAFIFNGELYLRCIPVKALFNSTLVHEVVNRGDIFALRVSDQRLTIIAGTSVVEHLDMDLAKRDKVDTVTVAKMKTAIKKPFDFTRLIQQELPL